MTKTSERNRQRKIARNRRNKATIKLEKRREELAKFQETKAAALAIYDSLISEDMFKDEAGHVDFAAYRRSFKLAWRRCRIEDGIRPPSAHGHPTKASA